MTISSSQFKIKHFHPDEAVGEVKYTVGVYDVVRYQYTLLTTIGTILQGTRRQYFNNETGGKLSEKLVALVTSGVLNELLDGGDDVADRTIKTN